MTNHYPNEQDFEQSAKDYEYAIKQKQSHPCPRCKEPYEDKCWHCGFNTDGQETYNESPEGRVKLSGGSSDYYKLPEGCKELQDLIEYKAMNFARANIFKAMYRLGEKPGIDNIYDLEKVIWFAQREIERIKKYEL